MALSRRPISRHTLQTVLTDQQKTILYTGLDCIETVFNELKKADKFPEDDRMGDSAEVWTEFRKLWGTYTAGETLAALQYWARALAARMTTALRRN